MNNGVLCKTLLAAACIVANVTDVVLAVSQAGPRPADQFSDAVRRGNIDLVRSMLADHSELVNAPDGGRNPPLHWAVIDGYPEIARLLLERGAKVNVRDQNRGMTAIFHAQSAEMVKLLIDHGAEFKLTAGDSGQTPLREAVDGGYVEVVNIFLEAGENLDFDAAVQLGLTDLVAAMLKENPSLAKPRSKPLHSAARQGNLELCKLLLEHGADPNLDYGFANIRGPYTPLSDAVTEGNYEVARLLLEHAANPTVSDGRNHHNLFLFAIAYLDDRFVKLMLEQAAFAIMVSQPQPRSRPAWREMGTQLVGEWLGHDRQHPAPVGGGQEREATDQSRPSLLSRPGSARARYGRFLVAQLSTSQGTALKVL